ncbi:hypothetical protein SAMN05518672_105270 [Chitinophaga sp. CF118]|uniref:PorT family protein n=1 Tax=Chitinophaga sp. CF118 TaxID=1884367 RepID=UPI0008E77918|nr:PorT family protein [Chitinophaga sp. CF118]SFE32056.1 hypothetical protein SAMN05518672_105270 [Chitinophaga sp. CF118]
MSAPIIRLSLLFVFLSFFTTVVSAQRNYVPVVITTLQNDSLRGFVDYRNWNISPSEIRFKESLTDEKEQHFGPGEIKAFRVATPDEAYVSRQVKLDITNQNMENLDEFTKRVIQDTLVFLQVIVTGEYNLYDYTDASSRHHFVYEVASKPGSVWELEYVRSFISNSTITGIYEGRTYQQQLAAIFADCPGVAKRALHVAYREDNIMNLFLGYNNCKNPSGKQFVRKKEKKTLLFGVIAGISSNSFKFSGPVYIFDGSNYHSSTSPVAGVFMDLAFNRNRRQFSFINELMYKTVKTEGTAKDGSSVKFGFSYVGLNTMIRYTYPKGLIRPIANVGISNSLVLSTKDNTWKRSSGREDVGIDGPRTYEQSFFAGAGVQVYKLNVEFRYATSNGFSPYSSSGVKVNSLQVIAGYRF